MYDPAQTGQEGPVEHARAPNPPPFSTYDLGVRIGLVGCVKTKLDRAAPAQDLYTSALFRGRRAFVAASCDRWYILSAKHGLLAPTLVVEPYEETLMGRPAAAKRRWAALVVELVIADGVEIGDATFEIHAGAAYRDFGLVDEFRRRGASVEIPAEHLSQGEQLAFYARGKWTSQTAAMPAATIRPTAPAARGSYAPLGDHLTATTATHVKLTFTQIERVLGRQLPASARRHRAWWSNETSGTHSHAAAWMGAGWRVDAVDLTAATAQFHRAGQ